MRTTKIIATLGPATQSADRIRALVEAGADILRINFSHGSRDPLNPIQDKNLGRYYKK